MTDAELKDALLRGVKLIRSHRAVAEWDAVAEAMEQAASAMERVVPEGVDSMSWPFRSGVKASIRALLDDERAIRGYLCDVHTGTLHKNWTTETIERAVAETASERQAAIAAAEAAEEEAPDEPR
jgi:hypothetical protein